MKKKGNGLSGAAEARSESSAPAARKSNRPRVIAFVVALALIGAAYGAGSLQGYVGLQKARADWKKERDQMSAAIEAKTKELATLKTQQALWQLGSGVSQVLAHLADKNYGLARDTARSMSLALSKAQMDMDDSMKGTLLPLGPLLEETSRAADSLSADARLKALQAQAMIQSALAPGEGTPRPSGSPEGPLQQGEHNADPGQHGP
jgi:cell division protein FtsB